MTAGSISTRTTCSTRGSASTPPRVIPAPRPITAADLGFGCSNMGRCPSSSSCCMSVRLSLATVLPSIRIARRCPLSMTETFEPRPSR